MTMADSANPSKVSPEQPPPRPDPIPGIGRPEVSKPIVGNPLEWFRRKRRQDQVQTP
jgi:hypothetical protein